MTQFKVSVKTGASTHSFLAVSTVCGVIYKNFLNWNKILIYTD